MHGRNLRQCSWRGTSDAAVQASYERRQTIAQLLFIPLHHLATHSRHSLHPPLRTQPPLHVPAPRSLSPPCDPDRASHPCCRLPARRSYSPSQLTLTSGVCFHTGPESAAHFDHTLPRPSSVIASLCMYTTVARVHATALFPPHVHTATFKEMKVNPV